ncbi:COGs COG3146 [Halomonas citrativorans]|uniref:COGs COG3146 n=1 Tax=Halomonas citrativorans TaxID=2742612 RepID=A0A1R4I612_9GAMM|nr:GNAT family N-acetyltransferase [Halomonas citrativorans]SJN15218.1 COGs COG3146 [Halomonas citrativorans]
MSACSLELSTLSAMEDIEASQWDALVGHDQPFLRHAFLHALEASGSVSRETGWEPCHACVWRAGQLVGALPMYRKHHSYGEYVFDWGWAEAFERAGGTYYPKALSAIPFTPVPGVRTLLASHLNAEAIRALLASAWQTLCHQGALSSWHLLFADEHDVTAWQMQFPQLTVREGLQFQWQDAGFGDFDGFLASLTSKRRKMIKRERRLVAEQGLNVVRLEGQEITQATMTHFYRCYSMTYLERGRSPYLSHAFFEQLRQTMPEALMLVQAQLNGQPVASALYFRGEHTLYGRYWGSEVEADCLHFEACYYQGIEYCLQNGLTRFDPGTQGEHKLVRGFAPQRVRSLHYMNHPGLAAGVAQFCQAEGAQVSAYREAAFQALPFKVPAAR